jgi:uncharacterized RDD family membrane protein YckC
MNPSNIGYAGRDRVIAFWLDNAFALILGFATTSVLPPTGLRWGALALVYFGYFFVSEALWARTPWKAALGLLVISEDGTRAGVKGAAIRTAARLLEANPLFFGALPGAIAVLTSSRKQRLGDMLGSTLVVKTRKQVPAKQAAQPAVARSCEPRRPAATGPGICED